MYKKTAEGKIRPPLKAEIYQLSAKNEPGLMYHNVPYGCSWNMYSGPQYYPRGMWEEQGNWWSMIAGKHWDGEHISSHKDGDQQQQEQREGESEPKNMGTD